MSLIRRARQGISRFVTAETRGAAMAEFIIVFPLQFLFILGIMQLALVYVGHIVVNHAAFAGARAALVADLSPGTSPEHEALRAAVGVCSSVAGETRHGSGGPPVHVPGWGRLVRSQAAAAKTRITSGSRFGGDAIVVEVEHDYELVIPVVNHIFAFPWRVFIYGDEGAKGGTFGLQNMEASRRHSPPGSLVPHLVIRENCWMSRPWNPSSSASPGVP